MRILIVDNDAAILDSMRSILELEGHEVACANGGRAGMEAFDRALKGAMPFGIVITDLTMPDTDGNQLARAIKERSPLTKVVLFTGWRDQRAGPWVDHVLAKPLRLRDLRAAITRCGEARDLATG